MSNNFRAVLDIGSNTIRLLIVDMGQQPMQRMYYKHCIARLGEGLQQTGSLGKEGQERALKFFDDVVAICKDFSILPKHVRAVATAALREASNSKDFVALVKLRTNLCIAIISGVAEAKLALHGALAALPEDIGQDMLLFDIGGGSTEFTRVHHGNIVDSVSQNLGVVRLTESLLHTDPPSVKDYIALKAAARASLDQVDMFWGNSVRPRTLVGTAGTVTTLAAIAQNMHPYQPSLINNYVLTRKDFDVLRDAMLSTTNAGRLGYPALEKGREDVIVAGLAIIEVIFDHWNYDALTVVDSGLLEGMLT